jgi:hypothetical protein
VTGFLRPDVDPFEGLPAHMIASRPLLVRVEISGPRERWIGGEKKIALDAAPIVHMVQLERDGRKLTHADRIKGWTAGEAEGWKPTPIKSVPSHEEHVQVDVEEEVEDYE